MQILMILFSIFYLYVTLLDCLFFLTNCLDELLNLIIQIFNGCLEGGISSLQFDNFLATSYFLFNNCLFLFDKAIHKFFSIGEFLFLLRNHLYIFIIFFLLVGEMEF